MPLTDEQIKAIANGLLEVVPGSHWLHVHSLLAEIKGLGQTAFDAGRRAGLEEAAMIVEQQARLLGDLTKAIREKF